MDIKNFFEINPFNVIISKFRLLINFIANSKNILSDYFKLNS